MQKYLILDYETRSEANLPSVGAYEYAVHPTTRILCIGWRWAEEAKLRETPINVWSPAVPGGYGELKRAFLDPDTLIVAHNAFFEQVITHHVFSKIVHMDVKLLSPERFICTASMAAALALPRNLEGACKALGLSVQKDMDGRRLMMKMAKPRKPTKDNPAKWHAKLSDLQRLMAYCKKDIEAETELFLTIPRLNPKERQVWLLDQKMNLRGFHIDRPAVTATLKMIETEKTALDKELFHTTRGTVQSATQRSRLLKYICEKGFLIPDLKSKTISDVLKREDVPPLPRRLLEIRQAVAKTSTAKYVAFDERSRSDGRVRDHTFYHGAAPGRFVGVGLNPLNFPRGTISNAVAAAEMLPDGDLEFIRMLYGSPMEVFSSCLRPMIKASPGQELFAFDFNAIETRVLFWLADHKEGLAAFHEGRDLYKEMAAKIFNVSVESVTKEQRELGKRAVLGCIAEGTLVWTMSGPIEIQNLKKKDLLWNGTQWVSHGGLLAKGLKSVIRIESLNIELTPDHWILTEFGWRTAGEIGFIEDTLLQESAKKMVEQESCRKSLNAAPNAVSWCAAYVELKKNVESINFGELKIFFAENALSHLMARKGGTLTETQISFLIQDLERVGELVSTISKKDVATLIRKTSRGMELAAFESPSNLVENFWNTLLHCAGLINGDSLWTELIMIGVMSPETYESFLKNKTTSINQKNTFDISEVGNNRFQAGDVIVHNCGYGMGHKKFHATCELHGQPVTEALALKAVEAYRFMHAPVVQYWARTETAALMAYLRTGSPIMRAQKALVPAWTSYDDFLWAVLPSERKLAYYKPDTEYVDTPWGEKRQKLYHWGVDPVTKQWGRSGTYGGRLVENLTQAVARDFLVEAMLRLDRAGYKLLLTVHDEILVEREIGKGSEAEVKALMEESPDWGQGCPIRAEGWKGLRYHK